jgi:hypothetical protein
MIKIPFSGRRNSYQKAEFRSVVSLFPTISMISGCGHHHQGLLVSYDWTSISKGH